MSVTSPAKFDSGCKTLESYLDSKKKHPAQTGLVEHVVLKLPLGTLNPNHAATIVQGMGRVFEDPNTIEEDMNLEAHFGEPP